jgi:hypothetical protein
VDARQLARKQETQADTHNPGSSQATSLDVEAVVELVQRPALSARAPLLCYQPFSLNARREATSVKGEGSCGGECATASHAVGLQKRGEVPPFRRTLSVHPAPPFLTRHGVPTALLEIQCNGPAAAAF